MKNKIYIFFLLILFLPIKLFAAELNKFEISLKKMRDVFIVMEYLITKRVFFLIEEILTLYLNKKYMFAFQDIPKNQLLVQKLKE